MYDDFSRDELLQRIRGLELISNNQFTQLENLTRVAGDVQKDLGVAIHVLCDGLRRIEGALDAIEKVIEEADQ